ncbi:hypothetical protein [Microbacterium sp.]|uniref:hypothetical protein n=1 Tax=Microbacterium sp. TaxID=51671 RepID=UPI002E31BB21|nr:hypothetical protein [Microbacterium sp.]HEX5728442.1 hypothetical protein [Microbacterium sp.]
MTMIMTKEEIHSLYARSMAGGDHRTAMICCRALGDSLSDAEPGTDGALVREEFTTQAAAEEVARILAREIELGRQMAGNIGGRGEPIKPPPRAA